MRVRQLLTAAFAAITLGCGGDDPVSPQPKEQVWANLSAFAPPRQTVEGFPFVPLAIIASAQSSQGKSVSVFCTLND